MTGHYTPEERRNREEAPRQQGEDSGRRRTRSSRMEAREQHREVSALDLQR